jgi:phosphoribosylamine-glycine ligase
MKFFIVSTYGEMLDVALHLQDVEKHEVVMWIPDHDHAKIGDGLIEKDGDWWNYLGGDWVFLVDGCERGAMQDWLRHGGIRMPRNREGDVHVNPNNIAVFGGSRQGDVLENDRQAGQAIFKDAGFYQPTSKNFTSIDDAIAFVNENSDKLWILKQNGDAPKSLNHAGHFDGNADMLWHLEQLKKKWNESSMGAFDCDLMEKVEGLEVACSAYFNGHDFMRNADGKVVAFLNFEEKKEGDGGLGETCGEMGTLFFTTTEDHPLVKDILMHSVLKQAWQKAGVRGVVDVNCIRTEKGMVALEFTNRPGVPSSSYEFCVATKNFGDVVAAVAQGKDTPIEVDYGWGMVMVVAAKPFPVEADMDETATSIGERLWILQDGQPREAFTLEQQRRIHLENFYRDDEGHHRVATKNGYLLTVTGQGDSIEGIRHELQEYIKANLYIAGMKYRTDIGKRVEEFEKQIGGTIPKPTGTKPKAKSRKETTLGY